MICLEFYKTHFFKGISFSFKLNLHLFFKKWQIYTTVITKKLWNSKTTVRIWF